MEKSSNFISSINNSLKKLSRKNPAVLPKKAWFIIFTISCFMFKVCAKDYTPEEAQTLRTAIVADAKKYIGCDYVLGAIGPTSFDCSGLIYTVFREAAAVQMPRSAKAIYSVSRVIEFSKAEPGDLVFFKTTGSDSISHVGIYIGKNQFIHAVSDGSNTGVIVSSLKEKYWKNCFAGTGRILPSGKASESGGEYGETVRDDEAGEEAEGDTASVSNASKAAMRTRKLTFDATVYCDWNFYLPSRIMLNWRGVTVATNASYDLGWAIKPGLGAVFRYNHGTRNFQIPILFSMDFNDYIRAYIGPVINIGNPYLPDCDNRIEGSFFPGVIGVSWQTPQIKAGKTRISFVQDVSYTVFNKTDGSAMIFSDSITTGLVFNTGVRVTLPMSNFF